MFKLFYISFILLLAGMYKAKSQILYPVKQGKYYGFMNTAGKVKIKPKFIKVNPFSENLACVRENGLYGFIDSLGTYVIPAKYDFAYSFKNGYAVVFENGEKKVIDTKGKTIDVDFDPYEEYNQVHNQVFEFQNDTINGFVTLCPFYKGRTFAKKINSSGYYLIDSQGNQVFKHPIYDIVHDISSFHPRHPIIMEESWVENKCIVSYRGSNARKYVLINLDGKILKTFEYSFVDWPYCRKNNDLYEFSGSLKNEYLPKNIENLPNRLQERKSRAVGFYLIKENVYIEPMFERIFYENTNTLLILAYKKDSVYYINRTGNFIWRNKKDSTNLEFNHDRKENSHFYKWKVNYSIPKEKNKNDIELVLQANPHNLWHHTSTFEEDDQAVYHKGILLTIKNHSQKSISIKCIDRKIYIYMEAKTKDGTWVEIEHPYGECLPRPVTIGPFYAQDFMGLKYHGSIKTKIRAKIFIDNQWYYSNEIKGSVNLGQLR